MARGVNKVILVGNLGNDPDVRFTANGSAVANLSVATSDSFKDSQGQMQDRTEWHRVVIFGKLAEVAQQYLRKGSKVYIEGSLRTNKWQDQSGNDRYSTEIVVAGFGGTMQMLDSRQDMAMGGGAPMGGYQQPQQQAAVQQQQYSAPAPQQQAAPQQQYSAPQAQQRPAQQPAQQQQQQPQNAPQAQPAGGFDDFDDDIPF